MRLPRETSLADSDVALAQPVPRLDEPPAQEKMHPSANGLTISDPGDPWGVTGMNPEVTRHWFQRHRERPRMIPDHLEG